MKNKFILTGGLFFLSGCSSIPLPGENGWESQETIQMREHHVLVEKIIAAEPEPVIKDTCAILPKPTKFSTEAQFAVYFLGYSNCQLIAGNEITPPTIGQTALQELESTRRAEIEKRGRVAGMIKDTALGFLSAGVDLHIASENRKSNEKIAKLQFREDDPVQPTITVHGDYSVGDGAGNDRDNDKSVDNRDLSTTDSNDQTTTTTDSRDLSTVDSNDDYSQTHTTDSNDQTTTTTDSRDLSDHRQTHTTTTNPAPAAPDPEAGGPDSEGTTTRAPSNTPNPFEDTCAGKFNTVECWAHYYDWERSLVDAAPFCNSQVPTDVAMCTKKLGDIDTLEKQREQLIRTGTVRPEIPGAN